MIALSITCRLNDVFMQSEIEKVSELTHGRCPWSWEDAPAIGYRQRVETLGGAVCGTTEDLIRLMQ